MPFAPKLARSVSPVHLLRVALLAALPLLSYGMLGYGMLSCGVAHAQEPAAPFHPAEPDTRADIPRSNTPLPPPIPLGFNAHFTGTWTGTLEYRDFSARTADAPHTRLPTGLGMRPSPDGRAVNLDFTYDDGPDSTRPGARKIVREREILAFTAGTAILTGTANAQNQSFAVQGIEAFARTGYGKLVLTGPGKENDQPVELRMTLVLAPGSFMWLKESRPTQAGGGGQGEFVFRDQYTLTQTSTVAPKPS